MERFIELPNANRALELDPTDGSLYVRIGGATHCVSERSTASTLSILPFLEIPVSEVVKIVDGFSIRHQKFRFPFDEFVLAGFLHGSPHWTACALHWLAELDRLAEFDFTQHLEAVIGTKKYPQSVRHKAQRLRARARAHE